MHEIKLNLIQSSGIAKMLLFNEELNDATLAMIRKGKTE